MGNPSTIQHDVLVVTADTYDAAVQAYRVAVRLFAGINDGALAAVEAASGPQHGIVAPIVCSLHNSYFSFMVGPDGSFDGEQLSETCNDVRAQFVRCAEALGELGDVTVTQLSYGDHSTTATTTHSMQLPQRVRTGVNDA